MVKSTAKSKIRDKTPIPNKRDWILVHLSESSIFCLANQMEGNLADNLIKISDIRYKLVCKYPNIYDIGFDKCRI